jgi:ATP-dependent exoDNAse (exonuclease V) beta subunit
MDLGQVSTDNEAAIRARALLYVAATRARHSLFICRLPKVVPHA